MYMRAAAVPLKQARLAHDCYSLSYDINKNFVHRVTTPWWRLTLAREMLAHNADTKRDWGSCIQADPTAGTGTAQHPFLRLRTEDLLLYDNIGTRHCPAFPGNPSRKMS